MDGPHTIPIATSDEPAARQPSSNVSPWAQFLAELRAYFVLNVMTTVWSTLLFAGGMIFLVYFFSIRFMPELNPQASITLLAAAVLTAGFLLITLISCLFAPLVFWKIWMPNYERLQILWYKDGKYAPVRSMLWVGLPFVVIVGGIFFLGSTTFKWFGINMGWGLVSLAIILLIFPLVLLLFWKKLPDSPPCILRWRVTRDLLQGIFLSFMGLGISLYTLNIVLGELHVDVPKTVMLSLIVLVWNFAMIVNIRQMPFWQYPVIPLMIFCFLLSISGEWAFIPKRVMNIFKFGNLSNASLVFDEIGCSIVQHHGVQVTPYTPNPITATTPSPKTTCSLPNATIHSRLGNTYYLEAFRNDKTSVRFTMPGQNVLSWAVNESQ